MVGVAKAEEEGGAVQELAAPLAVALSPDGKTLAVADTGNHRWPRTPATFHPRIRIYSANSGRPILSFGARGEGEARGGASAGPGQLERAAGVAWDARGNLLVLDTARLQVGRAGRHSQVFTPTGEWIRTVQVSWGCREGGGGGGAGRVREVKVQGG